MAPAQHPPSHRSWLSTFYCTKIYSMSTSPWSSPRGSRSSNRAVILALKLSPALTFQCIAKSSTVPPAHTRTLFKLPTHSYKALHNQGPSYLHILISVHTPNRNLHSAYLWFISIQRASANKGAFSCLAPKVCNDLSVHISATSSVLELWNKLKKCIFQ